MASASSDSGAITLRFLTTGSVQIHQSAKNQPVSNRNVLLRRLRSLLDRNWSDDLPIGVFVISHPQGPILFDTGESPCCNDPGFAPFYSPVKLFARTTIRPEDGIVEQLRKLDISPNSLQAIVLSHLHGDHAGGLASLHRVAPDVPIYLNEGHWKVFGNSPVSATLAGCNPREWPQSFAPKFLPFEDHVVGPWRQSAKVTHDGRILAVHTPGHVPGHISLIVHGDAQDGTHTTFFLPGDATYALDALDLEEPDGINDNPETALESLKRINEYARETPIVVLPSHDPGTPSYLENRRIYQPPASRSD